MKSYLWEINKQKLDKTNLSLYVEFLNRHYNFNSGTNFNNLWKWSVENSKMFWKSIWEFTKVKGNLGNILLKESNIFYKNKFFPDTYLNYAENLLKKNRTDPAILFKSEKKVVVL